TELKEFTAACDTFITVVESTLSAWQAISAVPTVYMPQPYPVDYTKQFFSPRTRKEKILFVAGVAGRPQILKGHTVARELQKQFSDYTIWVTDTPGEPFNDQELAGARYEKRPFEEWREHLQSLRTVALVVNTDFTQTRGRVQVDSAAVGTPSLGADSDGQRDLFPQLAATPHTPVSELVTTGARLLRDTAYYNEIVAYASERLAVYSYEDAATRLAMLVRHINEHA